MPRLVAVDDAEPYRGIPTGANPGEAVDGLVRRPAGRLVPVDEAGGVERFATLFQKAERDYGIPEGVLQRMAQKESAGNTRAVSQKGARGLMQFMPKTAEQYGVDVEDPVSSIDGAARYMRDLLKQFNGNIHHALAAYNAGQGTVRKHGGVPPFPETRDYVTKIMGGLQ